MPRATNKSDLINMANSQFDKLFKLIDDMKSTEQAATFCFDVSKMGPQAHWARDKNLRDVLTHLYEWHQLLINWEKANTAGITKPFLLIPYTWKNYGEMNILFWKQHQATSLDNAKQMVKKSHQTIMDIITEYSDQQLFTKALYPWTGTSSLGQYCISVTASHYDWAIKKLKAQIKACK